jgi:hypothetical protein
MRELTRDFKNISKDLSKDLVNELKDAAAPVKGAAESKAMTRITNMTPRWSGMRIGVSKARGLVFMVPSARRSGGSPRSNLAGLLFGEAMDPAVQENQDRVIESIDDFLDRLSRDYRF